MAAADLMALRTVEDYFIICTMGMGVILFSVMNKIGCNVLLS